MFYVYFLHKIDSVSDLNELTLALFSGPRPSCYDIMCFCPAAING